MITSRKYDKPLALAGASLAGVLVLSAIISYLLFTAASGAFDKKPDILLITARSLRPDHLGCYGYKYVRTSGIDSLSHNGLYFTNAYAPSTTASINYSSIMTGLDTGILSETGKDFILPPGVRTLPEYLKSAGYSTLAITTGFKEKESSGLLKGFDEAITYPATFSNRKDISFWSKPAEKALSILKEKREEHTPTFLWLEYSLPLAPYTLPEGFKKAENEHSYDRQIALLDQSISLLLESMRDLEMTHNTVIIFTSATGESLGEHTEVLHGTFVYNSTTKVPLIIHLPLDTKSRPIATPVSLRDLFLTILKLGKADTDTNPDIIDLLEEDGAFPDRTLYLSSPGPNYKFNWSPPAAIVKNGYKFIELPQRELYNLKKDPHELTNIITEEPGTAVELRSELYKYLEDNNSPLVGHLCSGADPKEKISVMNSFLGYRPRTLQGGMYTYKKLLEKDPDNITIKFTLARIYYTLKNYYDAKKMLMEILQERPDSIPSLELIALIYSREVDHENAAAYYKKILTVDPDNAMALNNLAWTYYSTGTDLGEALEFSIRSNQIEPDHPVLMKTLASIYEKLGEKEKAEELRLKIEEITDQNTP